MDAMQKGPVSQLVPNAPEKLILSHQTEEIGWWENKEFLSFLQNFHHFQVALLQDSHQQNRWIRRWLLLGLAVAMVSVGSGVALLYYYFSQQQMEDRMTHKLALTQQDFSHQLHQYTATQDARSHKALEKLYQESQGKYQHLTTFLLQLQTEQQNRQKLYEEQILALEKDRLSLQQLVQNLTTALTTAELTLLKAKAETQALQKQENLLQKRLEEANKQIQYWKEKAAEKLSAEELTKLHKEVEDDK